MMTNIVKLIQQDSNVASVGFGDYPVPYRKSFDLKIGYLLIVCSDGLSDMLTDDEIAAILKNDKNNMTEIADYLVAEANNRGGRDNISLGLVTI